MYVSCVYASITVVNVDQNKHLFRQRFPYRPCAHYDIIVRRDLLFCLSLSPFRLPIVRYSVGLFFTISTTREFRRQLVVLSNMNFLIFFFIRWPHIFYRLSLYVRMHVSLSPFMCTYLCLSPFGVSVSLSLWLWRGFDDDRARTIIKTVDCNRGIAARMTRNDGTPARWASE